MKKKMKRLFASLLACMLMFSSLTLCASADESDSESYHAFIAIGADGETAGSWGLQYYGEGAGSNAGACTAVEGELKNGETTTLSVTFEDTVSYTWFVAPCFVTDNAANISEESTFEVKVLLDGVEVATDLSAGKSCWAEDTGEYKGNCVRIGGGYNEWADKYIAEAPKGFKTIEFQITPHIVFADPSEGVLSTEEYPAFIGIGANEDWSVGYAGPSSTPSGIASVTDGVLKSGETTTISLTLENPTDHTWWVAPCMLIDNPATLAANTTFEVKTLIDGKEVATDLTVGKNFWAEGTGDYADNCVRIAGGYNEWGDKYLAESPSGYTTIAFEITPMIYIAEAEEEEAYVSAAGPVDVNGTYNAYLGIQTPKYSFRNAFDDATYGKDSDVFYKVTGWDGDVAVTLPGTFTDAKIEGNGTYTVSVDGLAFPDGEFADQDYMNLIFISTDIPNTNEVEISDVELKIDGKSVELAEGGAILSPDSKDYVNILIQNIWNEDVKTIGYYATPMSKISVTFTVSGFAYDKAAEVAEPSSEAAVESSSSEPSAETAVVETDNGGSGMSTTVIVVIVVAVVAVVAGAAVVFSKKKK